MNKPSDTKDFSPLVPQKSAKSTRSKTDKRYWATKLFKRTGPDYHVQVGFQGHQERFPLGTPNAETAATKARDIYLSLHAAGWEATRTKYKQRDNLVVKPQRVTVGAFLKEVQAVADIRPTTFADYARKFRSLVAEIRGISGGKERFDYFNNGAEEWRKKVDAVTLDKITPDRVAKWRVNRLKIAAEDPLKHKQTKTTTATIIRCSKSLFSPKKVLPNLSIKLPTPLPFDGIVPGGNGNTRYKSTVNAATLAQKAHRKLRTKDPEAYKVFILALGAGLRRDEIDTLTWNQINFDAGTIRVETNEHTATKSEESENDIDVDPALLKVLDAHRKTATGHFVIEWPVEPRQSPTFHHYRCHRLFRRVNDWLRKNGVEARNPLHTLRKEYGSLICKQAGIFAASAALRHTSITLTRDYYVDRKERIALPLGDLLKVKTTQSGK